MLAQDSRYVRNCFHGKEASAPLLKCACTGTRAFFAGSVACIQTGVLNTMHAQVFTLNRCCEHQRTHLLTRSLQDVHVRSCMYSLFRLALGNRDGGVQLVYEGHLLLGVGGYF